MIAEVQRSQWNIGISFDAGAATAARCRVRGREGRAAARCLRTSDCINYENSWVKADWRRAIFELDYPLFTRKGEK